MSGCDWVLIALFGTGLAFIFGAIGWILAFYVVWRDNERKRA